MRLLPPAQRMPGAVVRVFSARTLSWRGIVATHGWVVTLGWYDGVEFNLLGAVAGIDLRRPALKLPALGRLPASLGVAY
jgi:hypothetical protein